MITVPHPMYCFFRRLKMCQYNGWCQYKGWSVNTFFLSGDSWKIQDIVIWICFFLSEITSLGPICQQKAYLRRFRKKSSVCFNFHFINNEKVANLKLQKKTHKEMRPREKRVMLTLQEKNTLIFDCIKYNYDLIKCSQFRKQPGNRSTYWARKNWSWKTHT